jgi:hypothetical protein
MKIKKTILVFLLLNSVHFFAQKVEKVNQSELDTIKNFKLEFKSYGSRGAYNIGLNNKGVSFVESGLTDERGKYEYIKKIEFNKLLFIEIKKEIVKYFLEFYNSKEPKSCSHCMDGAMVTIILTVNNKIYKMETLDNPGSVNKDYKDFDNYLMRTF